MTPERTRGRNGEWWFSFRDANGNDYTHQPGDEGVGGDEGEISTHHLSLINQHSLIMNYVGVSFAVGYYELRIRQVQNTPSLLLHLLEFGWRRLRLFLYHHAKPTQDSLCRL
jgi:hypothetical protein